MNKKLFFFFLFGALNLNSMDNPLLPIANTVFNGDKVQQSIRQANFTLFKKEFEEEYLLTGKNPVFELLDDSDISKKQEIVNSLSSFSDNFALKGIDNKNLKKYSVLTNNILIEEEEKNQDDYTELCKAGVGAGCILLGTLFYLNADRNVATLSNPWLQLFYKSCGVGFGLGGLLLVCAVDNNSKITNLRSIQKALENVETNRKTLNTIDQMFKKKKIE